MKYLTCLVTILIMTVYGFTMAAFATTEGVSGFSLSTSSATVAPGGTFTVTATGNVTDMYAFESKFSYDATKLDFISATTSLTSGFSVPPVAGSSELVFAFTKLGNAAVENGSKVLTVLTFSVKNNISGTATVIWDRFMSVNKNLASTPIMLGTTAIITIGSGTPTPTPPPSGAGTPPTPVTPAGVIRVTPAVEGDVAKSILTQASITTALSQVNPDPSGVRIAVAEIKPVEGADRYSQALPVPMFQSGSGNQKLEIQTSLGTVTIPDNMMNTKIAGNASQFEVIIGQGDKSQLKDAVKKQLGNKPLLELTVLLDGKLVEWKNNKAPVTVSIKYTPSPEELKNSEHIAIWYIDGEGNVIKVPSGKYNAATGEVTFDTTHFSKYGIGYEVRSFGDLAKYSWANHQIEVMASKGIIEGTAENQFSPADSITRADFILLLVKTLQLTADSQNTFSDVSSQAYYAEAVQIAKSLGIAQGNESNQFNPTDPITRQDLMSLLARAMILKGQLKESSIEAVSIFTDRKDIASYAENPIAALVKAGIVQGDGNQLHPTGATTRAEAAVLLYRVYMNNH
ncbi:S-layer homology domain-containing protein [Paenibacillus whitsoniae]|uniref:SLH domain-containing protein n=1 Tax=Paenibacillus whitsoniae TaxID=2496558 RepID=A0A430JDS1_9BACL|nr:S-layer homology domain-containing protein [Paenibacillus whitsoniae]RTE09203.1 hypothetical protein EJQ19_12525 [Paenibacillus whitsoniae]